MIWLNIESKTWATIFCLISGIFNYTNKIRSQIKETFTLPI